MRARQLTSDQRRTVTEIAGRISDRLETDFTDPNDLDGPNVGLVLTERGHTVTIDLPTREIDDALDSIAGREVLRVRIKGRRDRMLFKPPPSRPAKIVERASPPSFNSFGGSFRGGGRGRR